MRTHSLAVLLLALLTAPAFAIDIVELKNGKIYQVESAKVKGSRLYVSLVPQVAGQKVAFAMPLEKVVPEYVYYIWAAQIDGDADGHLALAKWSRKNGLFKLAWKQYEAGGKLDPALHSNLPKIEKEMFEEQATWLYEDAEKLFRDGDVKRCRMRIELILKEFEASKESGRAKALLGILAEREQFLSEQKRQEEMAERARKQKRRLDKYLKNLVERADKLVLNTRLATTWNAHGRLHWAAYAYRKTYFVIEELLLVAEVDNFRKMLEGLLTSMENRMSRTFIKLADLRWINGDATGALDAVHEVLAVDPDSKAAIGLRDRILDGGGGVVHEPAVAPVCHGIGYYFRRPRIYATPYVRGFGVASPTYLTIGHRGGRYWGGGFRTTVKIPVLPAALLPLGLSKGSAAGVESPPEG